MLRYQARGPFLGIEPKRENKPDLLARFRDEGVSLIDLLVDPEGGTLLVEAVPDLLGGLKRLDRTR